MSSKLLAQGPGSPRQSVGHGQEIEPSGTLDGRTMTASDPFEGGEQITPSDTNTITAAHRALWIGAAGTLAGEMLKKDGSTAVFATSVVCGVFPFRCTKIYAAGTTATGIIAGW